MHAGNYVCHLGNGDVRPPSWQHTHQAVPLRSKAVPCGDTWVYSFHSWQRTTHVPPAAECALSSHVVPPRTFDYAWPCFRHRALSEGLRFGSPLSARAAAPGLDVARIWPCCCGLSSASSRSPVPACRPHSIPVNSKVVGASADFAPRPSKLSRLCASSFPSRLLVSRTQHDASQQCSRRVV